MTATLDPRTRLLLEDPPSRPRCCAWAYPTYGDAGPGWRWPDGNRNFVGKLGTNALAGMALVFPAVMLMQMTSAV